METTHQRALLLFDQGRLDLAENETRRILTQDPNDARAHALLALCLIRRDAFSEALFESAEGVRLDPAAGFNHYVRGHVLVATERSEQALKAARLAIELDPLNPAFPSLEALIHLNRRRWNEALAAAEQGLSADPEHVDCNNYRAMALVKLGRRQEAAASMRDALSLAPVDAFSHANQGWTLLNHGKPKEAMEHFKEALRLDPTLEWARAGIVEALKAHNIIYRWMLAYFLFMARLSSQAQWAIIFGGWIGMQVLRNAGRQFPVLKPFILPLLIAYGVFAVLTWLAYPFFNLLLRLSRYGRLALSREQTVAANWVGGTLAAALCCVVLLLFTGWNILIDLAFFFGLMTLPLSGFFNMDRGWPRMVMAGSMLVLCGIAGVHVCRMYELGGLSSKILQEDWERRQLMTTVGFGILAVTILANLLHGVRVKKG
jgi:tetratricopeptide (TPR) repeat protein